MMLKPQPMSQETLLEVKGLETYYGASQILFGLGLSLRQGETGTLLGRNGMGKTTMVKSILGLVASQGGEIRFRGERIDGLRTDRIARMGLAIVPEGRQIFPVLSVEENLLAFAAKRNASRNPWTLERVYNTFPGLQQRRKNRGNQLSGGEQQMLAIGRALMTNPYLLILDEATEGLAPLIREEIWRCLASLRSEGQSILVIDKYIQKLLNLADHHTIIERGQVVWTGSSAELTPQPEVWQRYVGV